MAGINVEPLLITIRTARGMALPHTGLKVAAGGNLLPIDRVGAPLCFWYPAVAVLVVDERFDWAGLWQVADSYSCSPTNRLDPGKNGSHAHSAQTAKDSSTDGRTANTTRSRSQRTL